MGPACAPGPGPGAAGGPASSLWLLASEDQVILLVCSYCCEEGPDSLAGSSPWSMASGYGPGRPQGTSWCQHFRARVSWGARQRRWSGASWPGAGRASAAQALPRARRAEAAPTQPSLHTQVSGGGAPGVAARGGGLSGQEPQGTGLDPILHFHTDVVEIKRVEFVERLPSKQRCALSRGGRPGEPGARGGAAGVLRGEPRFSSSQGPCWQASFLWQRGFRQLTG